VSRSETGWRTGIVLVGGRSSRIGVPKALLDLAGEPLLHHVVRALAAACDEIVLVAAPLEAQPPELRTGLAREQRRIAARWSELHGTARRVVLRPRVRMVRDAQAHLGPVAGLASGLGAARGALALAAACDLPFLAPRLVAALFALAEADPQLDVVVPRWRGYLEPLATVYRPRTTAPHFARQLAGGVLKPTARFDALRVRELADAELEALDPGGRSFLNLNAREDYEAARALAEAEVRALTARGSGPGRRSRGSCGAG
jgi:molybdopterin-guanine dinucleotide biosynthesis protein A